MTTEQAMTSAEWLSWFAHDDHEQDREVHCAEGSALLRSETPGLYEQGANLRVASDHEFSEYWD